MAEDPGVEFDSDLVDPRPLTDDARRSAGYDALAGLAGTVETLFGAAGFYDSSATPYPLPDLPHEAVPGGRRPIVEAVRQLWIGRWNPSDVRWRTSTGSQSDIGDPQAFPWHHPEMAPGHGWWITTERWPDPRLHPRVSDLVVVQRKRPVTADRRPGRKEDSDDCYIGLASVLGTVSALDPTSGRYETDACLAPLVRFTYPVPRTTAKTHGRLTQPDFRRMPAAADGSGMNRQLSAVTGEAATELLSVCGVSPEVLAEPDLASVAARLTASTTGEKALLDYRYDHLVRNTARRENEAKAEAAASRWASSHGFSLIRRDALVPLAGYDLLFEDGSGRQLQVEVKGYSSSRLADVHLQPSQVLRAQQAAAGQPPDWRLYALLDASTKNPKEHVKTAREVLALLASGGLQRR